MRCRKSRKRNCYCFQTSCVSLTRRIGRKTTSGSVRCGRKTCTSPTHIGAVLTALRGLRGALLVAEEQCDLSRVVMRRRNRRGDSARFTADARERLADVGFHAWYVFERWVQQRFHRASAGANTGKRRYAGR